MDKLFIKLKFVSENSGTDFSILTNIN